MDVMERTALRLAPTSSVVAGFRRARAVHTARFWRAPLWALLAVATSACATMPTTMGEPRLPPVPAVDGPLELILEYPQDGAVLTASDSTFVFGATGNGRATLRVNGSPVPVAPNGAFLAFLPVPPDGVYRLDADVDGSVATLERRVQPAAAPAPLAADAATILPGSTYPSGDWAALPDELIEIGFLGTPGGLASLRLPDGTRIPLVEAPLPADDAAARIFGTGPVNGAETETMAAPARYRATLPAGRLAAGADFELILAADTAHAPLALEIELLDPFALPTAILYDADIDLSADRAIVGRAGPGHTYHYFWPNGTEAVIDGRQGTESRVRLTPTLSAWVATRQVNLRPAGTPSPSGPIGTVRLTPYANAVDVRIETPGRLPFHVTQEGNSLTLTIYGGTGNTAWLQYGLTDPLIERLEWQQPDDHRYRLDVELTRPVWGYRTFHAENGDLVLRIRRPPDIDPDSPLRGLLIAVDAGHPPGGAFGPTGLTEAEANLAIAERLRQWLEAAGARVLMTRSGPEAVALQERPQVATDADAHLLVSIHNNAFPDGVNPFANNGTSTYYFHPHALDLARALQAELLAEFRLRDLGIGRSSLAVARATWMPAVLTETMYLMIPQHEHALRDPAVQDRIAQAHFRAIQAFLRTRAD